MMKDFFFYQGNPEIHGSRDASREAFKNGLIEDGEIWMDMIKIKNTDLLDLIDRVGRLFYEKE
ncbi:nucleotidyltransferase substrate binding protein [Cyclobacterium sp.]|uniref:nucleotidyltransferase substrate binding protein n=1 Tax=Cyclobacterium sp. TaxID=1966343 RepID=UPI0025BF7155|nr:nucleotidyltransferase substrate binding protein [Cyclobacterium sp.]